MLRGKSPVCEGKSFMSFVSYESLTTDDRDCCDARDIHCENSPIHEEESPVCEGKSPM